MPAARRVAAGALDRLDGVTGATPGDGDIHLADRRSLRPGERVDASCRALDRVARSGIERIDGSPHLRPSEHERFARLALAEALGPLPHRDLAALTNIVNDAPG
jgi:hypothetical protein